jgi:hypothetical protein
MSKLTMHRDSLEREAEERLKNDAPLTQYADGSQITVTVRPSRTRHQGSLQLSV